MAINEAVLKPGSEKLSRSNSLESLNSLISANGGVRKVVVKLPKLNLRPFPGKIHEWQEFWGGFNSAIHQNENLVHVDKFNDLKGYLVDKARAAIAGASYDTAVDLLKKQEGNLGERDLCATGDGEC